MLAMPAYAQQQSGPTPSQLANGITAAVIQMAQTIERQEAEIAELKKQLTGKDTPPISRGMSHALPQPQPSDEQTPPQQITPRPPIGMSHALPHPPAIDNQQ
jgi:hypothetical protein